MNVILDAHATAIHVMAAAVVLFCFAFVAGSVAIEAWRGRGRRA